MASIPMDDADFLNRFSRQNAAFGAEVTLKMTKMKALIVGLGGIGIETAKNLVLQGLGGVTIIDERKVEMKHLGCNFFLQKEDVGKSTAAVVLPRLRELNPLCSLRMSEALTEQEILQHTVVIISQDMSAAELTKWNTVCRNQKKVISFIYCSTRSVFGTVFVDHGQAFIINDLNGEQPLVRIIESIETGPEALVRFTVPDGEAGGSLPEDSYVEFSDVVGCDGIVSHTEEVPTTKEKVNAWKTTSKGSDPKNSVRIGDTSKLTPYVKGGIMTEKKVGQLVSFKSFEQSLADPGTPFCDMIGTDMLDFGSELQIHAAVKAALHGAKTVDEATNKLQELKDATEVNEMYFKAYFAHPADCELQPMGTFLGGIVGQEVVKCSGKFTPINGFFHFHAIETLPAETPTDTAPKDARYDNLAAIFGHSFVEKLGNLKYFMVGCGALGCEFLKNFALNGLCCGPSGKLTVTDADRIELSNLSRQFLFREHNVGQPKSAAAGVMAKHMNPDFKVESLEMFVGPKTEDHFNDQFWDNIDGVCNALDNMEARFYVDQQCAKYEKSLLESGTMGPSGNVDPVVPFLTRTYTDGGQAVEGGGIPMCTLRNFPHLPVHCIEWARDQFAAFFVKLAKTAINALADLDGFIAEKRSSTDLAQGLVETRLLLSCLRTCQNVSLKACAQLAFDIFHMLFRDKIIDLTTAFPEDARILGADKKDKGPFWSGHKMFPTAATYDPEDATHWGFMVAATNLFGVAFQLIPPKKESDKAYLSDQRSKEWINSVVSTLDAPLYVAGAINTEGDDDAKVDDEAGEASKDILARLLHEVKDMSATKLPNFEDIEFEKDDDLNFHIAFTTHCANLRAANYSIPKSDFQKVKLTAGRIIPAVATTTAAVTGLVMLELFKVAMKKPVEAFRQRLIGLAVNQYTSFEADPPKVFTSGESVEKPDPNSLPPEAFDEAGKIKDEYMIREKYRAYPEKHSTWDKLVVPDGKMTLGEFRAWFESEHRLDLRSWNFIIGWKLQEDEGKEVKAPVSSIIYPPPPVFDLSLLPAAGLSQSDAMKAIMTNPKIPQNLKMKYLTEWKSAGGAEASGAASTKSTIPPITEQTSLKDVLRIMALKADEACVSGAINPKFGKTIDKVDGRAFWVIPPDQTPSCTSIPTYQDGDDEEVDVKYLAAIKIPLS
eukprot:GEMP01001250.1.p1 GENE.GEMP01001250.1~~GEMP01001250.1.p1  ORF type:complete len:1203 (-),score=302.19 GEMP01001250.1:1979-5488(-)